MSESGSDQPPKVTREVARQWFELTDPGGISRETLRRLAELGIDTAVNAASKADKSAVLSRINVGLCVAVLALAGTFFVAIRAEAKDSAASVRKQLEEHIVEEKAELREVRQDLKELYKVILTRKKSERLEKPLPDGGSDD